MYTCNDPKFSDRQAWVNSVDTDQSAPGLFWTHYSMVKPQCSNFIYDSYRNVSGVRIFRSLTVL